MYLGLKENNKRNDKNQQGDFWNQSVHFTNSLHNRK